MEEPKLITLRQAARKSVLKLYNNESLGFLFKSYIAISFLLSLIALVLVIIGSFFWAPFLEKQEAQIQTSYPGPKSEFYYSEEERFTNLSETTPSFEYRKPSRPSVPRNPGLPSYPEPQEIPVGTLIFTFFASLAAFLFGLFAGTVLILATIKIHENNYPNIKKLFLQGLKKTPKFVVFLLIFSIIISIGYVLLIVPGIILSIKLLFSPYFLLKENTGILEAFKKSAKLTKGFGKQLFIRGVLFTLIMLVLTIPVLILAYTMGALLMPLLLGFTHLTLLNVFNDLKKKKDETSAQENPEEPNSPKKNKDKIKDPVIEESREKKQKEENFSPTTSVKTENKASDKPENGDSKGVEPPMPVPNRNKDEMREIKNRITEEDTEGEQNEIKDIPLANNPIIDPLPEEKPEENPIINKEVDNVFDTEEMNEEEKLIKEHITEEDFPFAPKKEENEGNTKGEESTPSGNEEQKQESPPPPEA